MLANPQILSTKIVAKSRLYSIEEVHLRFSNGQERKHERLINHFQHAVLIVPMLDDDTLLLVREYAVGVERYELNFPGGVIDAGEDYAAAANRELMEEAGYGARNINLLKTTSTVPGYQTSIVEIVLARELYPAKLEGDEAEALEVIPWRLQEMDKLLQREDFSAARNIAALFLAREYFAKI